MKFGTNVLLFYLLSIVVSGSLAWAGSDLSYLDKLAGSKYRATSLDHCDLQVIGISDGQVQMIFVSSNDNYCGQGAGAHLTFQCPPTATTSYLACKNTLDEADGDPDGMPDLVMQVLETGNFILTWPENKIVWLKQGK